MRRATALLALLALPLIWPAWAQAHATLLTTTPGAGTRVAAPPHQLVLTFDQQIRPVSGGTTVVDAAGKSVMAGPATNAPGNLKQLVVPLQQGLPAGDYTVRWGIVSTDGHLIAGVYAFGVGTGGPVPQAESQDAPTDWPFLIARFFYFAGSADAGRRRRLPRGRLPARHRRGDRRAAAADGPARTPPRQPGAGAVGGAGAGRRLGGADAAGCAGGGCQLLGGVRSPRPGCLGAGRDPLRPPVRARHRRDRGVHDPGRPGLRHGRRQPPADRGAGGAGGDRRGLGAGRTGHLRARGRPRPRPAGDRPGRPARRRGRDLDRRPGAAGRGHAPCHARPHPAVARRHPRQDRRALLADGGGGGGGAGRDRRPAGAVGAVRRVADLDDLLRPHAAGKDGAAPDDAGGRVAQPPVPGPLPDAAALGHRRAGGAVGGGGGGCAAHQPAPGQPTHRRLRCDHRDRRDGHRGPAETAGRSASGRGRPGPTRSGCRCLHRRRRPACTCSRRTAHRCPRS